ncbi:MAG: hypothetical protein ACHQ4J_16080 [Candidatus Binatia bacterium]
MPLSVKSERILKRLGVLAALARGEPVALVGPIYELRKDPGVHARLAFLYDDERRLCVGCARDDDGEWRVVESEPFSLRGLGYYQRHLKRTGDVIGERDTKR